MPDDSAEITRSLLEFIDASPTPFHAVSNMAVRLQAAGFEALVEGEAWSLSLGGSYYIVRGESSLIAFTLGDGPIAESGVAMVGAHTDSPNLRIKPRGDREHHGYQQVGVEVYGGALLASWTDRDLGIAGRVMVKEADGVGSRLVLIRRPIARVPQLAIHLNREVNDVGLKLDRELHMRPVLGLADAKWQGVEELCAEELGIDADTIIGQDLMFFDVSPSTVGGVRDEFIFAPRLDNLASCHAGLEALLDRTQRGGKRTALLACYDHEEVGSTSTTGASGSLLSDVLSRIVPNTEDLARARSRSLLVSVDMAHAVHPNYADRHESEHMPHINAGPVIKHNANVRYATDATTAAAFRQICERAEVPVQEFVMRANLACGSTIGPLVASRVGTPVVDVGNAMLSMHSIREQGGAHDQHLMIRAMREHFSS